jgi:hypothetical protein
VLGSAAALVLGAFIKNIVMLGLVKLAGHALYAIE